MAATRNARWLLVEWSDGSRCVVNVRAVVDGAQQFKVGDEVTVTVRGAKRLGKLVNHSDDRKGLDLQVKPERAEQETTRPEAEGPNLYEDLEVGDFSPSGSSWGPEEQQLSSDSEAEVDSKKIKLESIKRQYSNKGNKIRTPTLRPEPVIPKSQQTLRQSQLNFSSKVSKRKQDLNKSMPVQQAIADSTRSQVCASPMVPLYNQQRQTNVQTISISGDELAKVKNDLRHFKEVITALKSAVASLRSTLSADYLYETIYATKAQDPVSNMILPNEDGPIQINLPKDDPNTAHQSTETIKPVRYGLIQHNPNRRKRQVQPPPANITPAMRKHGQQANQSHSSPENEHNGDVNDEMVPIGSGKTMVPRSVYVRINWDSYTMATRKLLVAVFPRKILATHSLTGKASPAFTDRPAKLCLDPKKVSDVAMEVTKRCKVKEGLVRGVITTKCADEYKMFRMQCHKEKLRKSKHTSSFRLLNNQENLPPESRHGPTEGYQSTSYNQTL